MTRRALVFALLSAAVALGADPERPNPKLYPDKWEKDGITVAVEEGEYGKETFGVRLRVTNGSKEAIKLKGGYADESFMTNRKADPKSPLAGVRLADGLGEERQAVLLAVALKGGKEEGDLRPGESAILSLGFARPLSADKFYLKVPAGVGGLPAEVRVTVPAAKIPPEPKGK